MFKAFDLIDALEKAGESVTDEASAMEKAGDSPSWWKARKLTSKLRDPQIFGLLEAILDKKK